MTLAPAAVLLPGTAGTDSQGGQGGVLWQVPTQQIFTGAGPLLLYARKVPAPGPGSSESGSLSEALSQDLQQELLFPENAVFLQALPSRAATAPTHSAQSPITAGSASASKPASSLLEALQTPTKAGPWPWLSHPHPKVLKPALTSWSDTGRFVRAAFGVIGGCVTGQERPELRPALSVPQG